MHDFHYGNLPGVFNNFFEPARERHKYNTRSAAKSNYCLPYARTNYGKFNVQFNGVKLWNNLDIKLREIRHKNAFKKQLSSLFINKYIEQI